MAAGSLVSAWAATSIATSAAHRVTGTSLTLDTGAPDISPMARTRVIALALRQDDTDVRTNATWNNPALYVSRAFAQLPAQPPAIADPAQEMAQAAAQERTETVAATQIVAAPVKLASASPDIADITGSTGDRRSAAPERPEAPKVMGVPGRAVASLGDGGVPKSDGRVTLPHLGSRLALYDISARVVYLPNGERLEAHSGLAHRRDNPRYVREKNYGPTPPNLYRLSMREAPFHGVRALRLNPVDNGAMFGRDGILAHTYMLGPGGDSNGCVSFKNYPRFLRAFLDGDVSHIAVVSTRDAIPSQVASALRGGGT